MLKPYKVTVTFQVTERLSIRAGTPEDAIQAAIGTMDGKYKGGRFVKAETKGCRKAPQPRSHQH